MAEDVEVEVEDDAEDDAEFEVEWWEEDDTDAQDEAEAEAVAEAMHGLAVGGVLFGVGFVLIRGNVHRALQVGARKVEGMGYRIIRQREFQFAGRWYMILLVRQM